MLGRRALIALPAIAIWLAACGPTPDQVNNAGHQLYTNNDYQAALDSYEGARDLAPKSAEPRYNVGNALYRLGEFEESLLEYDEALRYARGDLRSRAFFNRGNAAFQAQMYKQAVEAYEEVLRMNPDDHDAKHNLEIALRQLPPQAQDEEQASPQAQSPQPQEAQPPPQAQPPPPEPQTEPLTGEQAKQVLEAVGEDAQTLQERRQQTLISPKPQIEFDW